MRSYFFFGMHYDIAEYFNFSAQRVKITLGDMGLINDNCAVENKLVD